MVSMYIVSVFYTSIILRGEYFVVNPCHADADAEHPNRSGLGRNGSALFVGELPAEGLAVTPMGIYVNNFTIAYPSCNETHLIN